MEDRGGVEECGGGEGVMEWKVVMESVILSEGSGFFYHWHTLLRLTDIRGVDIGSGQRDHW